MKKKQLIFFVLFMALLPCITWAQSRDHGSLHLSFRKDNGDSIQMEASFASACSKIRPILKNGNIAWSFISTKRNTITGEWEDTEKFSLDEVTDIYFPSYDEDSINIRNALIEFYQAMDGDNWIHNDNWCSDKPIGEWYGVNVFNNTPWPDELELTDNYLSGTLPECISKFGPISQLKLWNNNITGELPALTSKSYNYNLRSLRFHNNKLSGAIPEDYLKLMFLDWIDIAVNQYEGNLPEEFILAFMNKVNSHADWFTINGNNFSGKIPMSIQNHPRFSEYWLNIIQDNSLDLSDLTIPAPIFKTLDTKGDTIDLAAIYKKNKYTLLYKWGWWCPYSEAYNQKLIPTYLGYKDKGFEVIGFHIERNEQLQDYTETHDIPWLNSLEWARDENHNPSAILWNPSATPLLYLVDNNGHIVFTDYIDEKGKTFDEKGYATNCYRRDSLFSFLEEHIGKIDYQFYTSTDYTKDGEVVTLQQATEGKGIDLVFVGEGFVDKDYEEGGCFIQHMNKAMEQFFAYEPYTSLRNRFNVYAVKAVSPNAEFLKDSRHAIDEDISTALLYASKVPDLKEENPMRVAVIYKNMSGGRSYCNMFEDNSFVCFAMEGVNEVLNHEAGGHGIGRLLDEYIETGNETLTLPEENKDWLEFNWSTYSWGANVDWRSNPTEVKWRHFINDTRYADEQIGVYEGSYLYGHGAYRPTENSMMRYNDTPFNAPSREEIYKRVMKASEGDSWNYDYETFVSFDAAGREQFVNGLAHARELSERRGYKEPGNRTLPPVLVKGTWRDAIKKK